MIDDDIRNILKSHLGVLRSTPNGWQSRNCPMCISRGHNADSRSRFGIKFPIEGGVKASCFNCGFLASWQPGWDFPAPLGQLMHTLGVSEIDVKRLKFQVYKEKHSILSHETGEYVFKKPVTEQWVTKPFPDGTFPISQWVKMDCQDRAFLKVLEYAYWRGIRDFDNVYWCPSKEKQYDKRLIFPFYYDNKIVGWSGRYYLNTASKQIPKYLNMMPESYIYNLDHQKSYQRKCVILTEGMMDAYFVDGVGALHSTLNDDQIHLLNSLQKTIIVCPDRDNDGDTLVEIAKQNKWKVSFPKWHGDVKDTSDAVQRYGKIVTIKSILDNATANPLEIEVKRKFDKMKWSSYSGDRV